MFQGARWYTKNKDSSINPADGHFEFVQVSITLVSFKSITYRFSFHFLSLAILFLSASTRLSFLPPYIFSYLPLETTIADYVWELFNTLRLATNFTEISFCLATEAHWTKTFVQKSEFIRNRKFSS
jgi:hypothetical protein